MNDNNAASKNAEILKNLQDSLAWCENWASAAEVNGCALDARSLRSDALLLRNRIRALVEGTRL